MSVTRLSARLAQVKPSPTLTLNAKARALAATGVDVVSFAAGEPDFDTPAHIVEAGKAALSGGQTRYTSTAGVPELREAVSRKLARENALSFTPEQVLVTAGAKQALYNLFQALLSPGDEVLIFAPYWVSYPEMVRLADGRPVIIPTEAEHGWSPTPEALARALTARTRAVVVNSPSNPTGALWSRPKLGELAEVLRPHPCVIVLDDIYERLVYPPAKFANLVNVAPDLLPRTVVVNGFSKAYAMTGWRLGWAAGPRELIAAMTLVQEQSTSNASSVSQWAGLAALEGPQDPVKAMVEEYARRRDVMVERLNALGGVRCARPEGALYCLADVRGLIGRRHRGRVVENEAQFCEFLLEDRQVVLVPGGPFGSVGHVRLTFATSLQAIEDGLRRLGRFVRDLD